LSKKLSKIIGVESATWKKPNEREFLVNLSRGSDPNLAKKMRSNKPAPDTIVASGFVPKEIIAAKSAPNLVLDKTPIKDIIKAIASNVPNLCKIIVEAGR
jgi:hypothetical protein